MDDSHQNILCQAIARNATAVLSLPSAGAMRNYKTRFLGEADGGFWVEAPPGEGPLLDELIAGRQPVGLAFKSETHKVIFLTPIGRRIDQFALNTQTQVAALFMEQPRDVKIVQRRGSYRVRVPQDGELSVRVWRIPDHAILRDKPLAAAELPVTLRNISLGGMGLICAAPNGQAPRLVADERLRVVLTCQGVDSLMEARVRHCRPLPDGSLKVGAQFRERTDSIEDRQNFSRMSSIVGQLQREEVRRMRMGFLDAPAESA